MEMNLISALLTLFKRKAYLKLGVSRTARGPVHALVAVYENEKNVVLSCGTSLSFVARLFCPPTVNTDLGNIPVFFVAAQIGKEEPDSWIDRNEGVIIPNGLTADQVINEYIVEGEWIYSATISTNALNSVLVSQIYGTLINALGVPLRNLAKLYGREIVTPFVLWRISAEGSVVGYIENGTLQRLVHCYVDCADLVQSPEESVTAIEGIIRSLSCGNIKVPVVIFSPERGFSFPSNCTLHDFTLKQPPSFRGIQNYCHEAYANALLGDDGHNFMPFDLVQKAFHRNKQFNLLRSTVRISVAFTVGMLLLFGVADGVLFAVGNHYRETMAKVKAEGNIILAAEKRRDVLLKEFHEKMKFETGRSHCTTMLSDLQTAFPEGSWAEAISITEIDTSIWQCEIQALSRSSGLIGNVLEALGKISGTSNARMTYSEQITQPDKSKVIRFKVKCEWK